MVKAVADLSNPKGSALACRVGIATGPVVVGDLVGEGAAQEEAVVGETPNVAARLQQLAEPGSVIIAESTRRLLGSLFDLVDLDRRDLHGLAEPVRVWRVLGEGRAESRFEAMHADGISSLVGREQELALLLDRWQLAKAGEGQVVLLSGEAGIGKSRILLELRERRRAEKWTSIHYFCSSQHTETPLWPSIVQLERAAGFERGDTVEMRLAKLEVLVRQAGEDTTAEATTSLFAELLSLPATGRYAPAELTPQEKKARTLRAHLGQLEGLAARRPVLLILEDAHWLDPTTGELFDLVVDQVRRLPVLLVVTGRPEFRPGWFGLPHVTLLTLNRLARYQAERLVLDVTGGRRLPQVILDEILAKTEGVPLFLEEVTKAVLESGFLRPAGDALEVEGKLPPLAVPSTLHDSLMARLDRFASAREAAQVGAVLGHEFGLALLAEVAGAEPARLEASLDQLVAAELCSAAACRLPQLTRLNMPWYRTRPTSRC